MCVFKIVFSSLGQLTSCGSASSTALISSLNSIRVQRSAVIRYQGAVRRNLVWFDQSYEVRVVPYTCSVFWRWGAGRHQWFFQCSMLGVHLVQWLGVPGGFLFRLFGEWVSTGVISSAVNWRTFGSRCMFPHLLWEVYWIWVVFSSRLVDTLRAVYGLHPWWFEPKIVHSWLSVDTPMYTDHSIKCKVCAFLRLCFSD